MMNTGVILKNVIIQFLLIKKRETHTKMSSDEENIFMARVAEQAERFEDMI